MHISVCYHRKHRAIGRGSTANLQDSVEEIVMDNVSQEFLGLCGGERLSMSGWILLVKTCKISIIHMMT